MNAERVATYDLVMVQGQDGDGVLFPLVDNDGAPVDPTGWTARAQVRADQSLTSRLLDDLVTSCTADGVLVRWTGATSDGWNWVEGYYDVRVTQPSGDDLRIAQGRVRVSPAVTS